MIQIYDKTSVRLKKARHLKLVQPIIDIADTLVIISNRVDNGFMVIRFNKNNVFAPGIFEQFFPAVINDDLREFKRVFPEERDQDLPELPGESCIVITDQNTHKTLLTK